MVRVQRIDASTITKAERRSDGFLRVPIRATRTGVFLYEDANGKPFREYRPPEEVFNPRSMDSLKLVPVTNEHPPFLLTSQTAKAYMVGYLGSNVFRENEFLNVDGCVTEERTIQQVESGKVEVSCGYDCDLEMVPGVTPEGEAYDAIQRNILYNHLAITEAGRAGHSVRIRLDSQHQIIREDNMKVEVNGKSYDCSNPELADAVSNLVKAHADLEAKMGEAKASKEKEAAEKAEKEKAEAETAEKDSKEAEEDPKEEAAAEEEEAEEQDKKDGSKKMDSAKRMDGAAVRAYAVAKVKKLNARVDTLRKALKAAKGDTGEKMTVLDGAKVLIGDSAAQGLAGKSVAEIVTACVTKVDSKTDPKASAEYLRGRFDSMVAAERQARADKAARELGKGLTQGGQEREDSRPIEERMKAHKDALKEKYKAPLSATKPETAKQ